MIFLKQIIMITLGYRGVRGRAHTLRLLLEYTGADWQETNLNNDSDWFGRDQPDWECNSSICHTSLMGL